METTFFLSVFDGIAKEKVTELAETVDYDITITRTSIWYHYNWDITISGILVVRSYSNFPMQIVIVYGVFNGSLYYERTMISL